MATLKRNENGELCFEHNGQEITYPFVDETMRDEVDPIEYYGITAEQVDEIERDLIRRSQEEMIKLRQEHLRKEAPWLL